MASLFLYQPPFWTRYGYLRGFLSVFYRWRKTELQASGQRENEAVGLHWSCGFHPNHSLFGELARPEFSTRFFLNRKH